MATEIKVWQIVNDNLELIETDMEQTGRREADLENWIKNNPQILGQDILIIGNQVSTKAGKIDLLGIDKEGNLIIIELKRDKVEREALAQAIDYASEISSWDVEKINEVCIQFTGQKLEDILPEKFGEEVDLENLVINESQRILIVGFSIGDSLSRMIEWLSEHSVSINAVVLKYIKTKNGEELIARTVIIPEEIEKERSQKRRIQREMSDEPGNYDEQELEDKLIKYLSDEKDTPRWIRKILLPLCLDNPVVTRKMIMNELIKRGEARDEGKAIKFVTVISRVIGYKGNDFLRQVIRYDKIGPQERENYRIPEEYKELVRKVLIKLDKEEEEGK